VAVVIISLGHGFSVNLRVIFFGSITTVSRFRHRHHRRLRLLIVTVLAVFYKEFFCVAFNEELAAASGMNVRVLNIMLIVLAAVTVSLSLRIVARSSSALS